MAQTNRDGLKEFSPAHWMVVCDQTGAVTVTADNKAEAETALETMFPVEDERGYTYSMYERTWF